MVIVEKTIKLEDSTLKILEKIAKNKETTENNVVNDFILKGIEKIEEEEEKGNIKMEWIYLSLQMNLDRAKKS